MVLSCVKRMDEKFGVGMTAKVLRGSKDKKMISFRVEQINYIWHIIKLYRKRIDRLNSFLIAEQLLATDGGQYPTLKLNKNSVAVLKGEKRKFGCTQQPV